MSTLAINPAAIALAQHAFLSVLVKPGTFRNDADYARVLLFVNSLLDVLGDDEAHELANLLDRLDLVGQLLEACEGTRHVIADAGPHEVLRFMLDQHGLEQSDLAAEIGGQSVVSDILSGKRAINARQAKALAARFGVSAAAVL